MTLEERKLLPENLDENQDKQWFVMRDFKKLNAKTPAYKELCELGVHCFTPMHWVITVKNGRKKREYVPIIQNLLFVYECRDVLDPIVGKMDKLQYQFKRGGGQGAVMTVSNQEMERFINAVSNDASPIYYKPDELTMSMVGKDVIINGGPLNGYSGKLLKMQGSKKRRLIVEIKGFFAAAVEVDPDFVQVIS